MRTVVRFRIWHLLVVMAFVACWVPISKWLLALEARDHPRIPQTTFDVVCFYLGSITIVGIPFVAVVWFIEHRRMSGRNLDESKQHGDLESASA
jgi:hypothetical protein